MYDMKSSLHILQMQAIKKPEDSWLKQFASSGLRVQSHGNKPLFNYKSCIIKWFSSFRIKISQI